MNTESTSLFDLAPKRLQWLATRQAVVSENIANADVLGYRAKDVQSFASYLGDADRASGLQDAEVVQADVMASPNMSGNNMEANSTAGQFKVAANLYRKAYQMIYTVAGRR